MRETQLKNSTVIEGYCHFFQSPKVNAKNTRTTFMCIVLMPFEGMLRIQSNPAAFSFQLNLQKKLHHRYFRLGSKYVFFTLIIDFQRRFTHRELYILGFIPLVLKNLDPASFIADLIHEDWQ